MIDLKKPFEGGPGLLLMAVMVFFGAVLGVIAAKLFASIRMEADMANFLGGVMGAALGSAGAVLGAVYVHELKQRAVKAVTSNVLREKCAFLATHFHWVGRMMEACANTNADRALLNVISDGWEEIEVTIEALPEAADVSQDVHRLVLRLKRHLSFSNRTVRAFLEEPVAPLKLQPAMVDCSSGELMCNDILKQLDGRSG